MWLHGKRSSWRKILEFWALFCVLMLLPLALAERPNAEEPELSFSTPNTQIVTVHIPKAAPQSQDIDPAANPDVLPHLTYRATTIDLEVPPHCESGAAVEYASQPPKEDVQANQQALRVVDKELLNERREHFLMITSLSFALIVVLLLLLFVFPNHHVTDLLRGSPSGKYKTH